MPKPNCMAITSELRKTFGRRHFYVRLKRMTSPAIARVRPSRNIDYEAIRFRRYREQLAASLFRTAVPLDVRVHMRESFGSEQHILVASGCKKRPAAHMKSRLIIRP